MPTKRPRQDKSSLALTSQLPRQDKSSLALTSQLEARPTEWAGHGVFALADLPEGWMWKDHPVCVPRRAGEAAAGVAERRLPRADDVDELMQELSERALAGDERCGRLLVGEWAMTHMPRHLEAQGDGPDELPQWALDCGTPAASYNLLAAQLQSNVARHAEGGGFVLNPQACAMHTHMICTCAPCSCTCDAIHAGSSGSSTTPAAARPTPSSHGCHHLCHHLCRHLCRPCAKLLTRQGQRQGHVQGQVQRRARAGWATTPRAHGGRSARARS